MAAKGCCATFDQSCAAGVLVSMTLTEVFDSDNYVSGGTTITIPDLGWYAIICTYNSPYRNRVYGELLLNGSSVLIHDEGSSGSSTQNGCTLMLFRCFQAGDTVTVRCRNSGFTDNIFGQVVVLRIPGLFFVGDASSGTANTPIPMTESVDLSGMHDPSVNPSRVTIQSAGKYLLMGRVSDSGSSTNAYEFRKNGTQFLTGRTTFQQVIGTLVCVADLAINDYIELVSVTNDTGAAQLCVAPLGSADCVNATQPSAQAINSSALPVDFTFPGETVDTNNFHSTSSNTARLTFPSTSVYFVAQQIRVGAFLVWNATLTPADHTVTYGRVSGRNSSSNIVAIAKSFNAGQDVVVRMFHDLSGTAFTIQSGMGFCAVDLNGLDYYDVDCAGNLIVSKPRIMRYI